jgi:hypothetical protein
MREDPEGNERRLKMKELRGKSTRKAQKERVQIKVEELRQVEGCKNPTGKQYKKNREIRSNAGMYFGHHAVCTVQNLRVMCS